MVGKEGKRERGVHRGYWERPSHVPIKLTGNMEWFYVVARKTRPFFRVLLEFGVMVATTYPQHRDICRVRTGLSNYAQSNTYRHTDPPRGELLPIALLPIALEH